jgi:hypothetical protein
MGLKNQLSATSAIAADRPRPPVPRLLWTTLADSCGLLQTPVLGLWQTLMRASHHEASRMDPKGACSGQIGEMWTLADPGASESLIKVRSMT